MLSALWLQDFPRVAVGRKRIVRYYKEIERLLRCSMFLAQNRTKLQVRFNQKHVYDAFSTYTICNM